jgi:hypothetical protein
MVRAALGKDDAHGWGPVHPWEEWAYEEEGYSPDFAYITEAVVELCRDKWVRK